MDRYASLQRDVAPIEDVGRPMHAETYNPPHRPAGHSPYDAVLPLFGDWDEDDVEELLEDQDITYDRITGVMDEVDDPRRDGDALAFISLTDYSTRSSGLTELREMLCDECGLRQGVEPDVSECLDCGGDLRAL